MNRECPNLICEMCKHHNITNGCNKLPKDIEFYVPSFASCSPFGHCICRLFEPYAILKDLVRYNTFDEWYEEYKAQWMPNREVAFHIAGNRDIAYKVPMELFVNATMIDNGILKATSKVYYKRARGYQLVRESINGVRIKTQESV